jgi:hypothetical protein
VLDAQAFYKGTGVWSDQCASSTHLKDNQWPQVVRCRTRHLGPADRLAVCAESSNRALFLWPPIPSKNTPCVSPAWPRRSRPIRPLYQICCQEKGRLMTVGSPMLMDVRGRRSSSEACWQDSYRKENGGRWLDGHALSLCKGTRCWRESAVGTGLRCADRCEPALPARYASVFHHGVAVRATIPWEAHPSRHAIAGVEASIRGRFPE